MIDQNYSVEAVDQNQKNKYDIALLHDESGIHDDSDKSREQRNEQGLCIQLIKQIILERFESNNKKNIEDQNRYKQKQSSFLVKELFERHNKNNKKFLNKYNSFPVIGLVFILTLKEPEDIFLYIKDRFGLTWGLRQRTNSERGSGE